VIPKPNQDINALHPIAKNVLLKLIDNMTARGEILRVWETHRTDERADYVLSTGASHTGRKSTHCLRIAFDCVDKNKLWSNPAFFKAYHEEGKKLGLHQVHFIKRDKQGKKVYQNGVAVRILDTPHLQLIAVNEQDKYRAMSEDERTAFLAAKYPWAV
jgi:hypothetical protein